MEELQYLGLGRLGTGALSMQLWESHHPCWMKSPKGNPHLNSVSNPKIVEALEGGKMFMTPSGKNFRNNMHKIKL